LSSFIFNSGLIYNFNGSGIYSIYYYYLNNYILWFFCNKRVDNNDLNIWCLCGYSGCISGDVKLEYGSINDDDY
jgi:hypothetical protein